MRLIIAIFTAVPLIFMGMGAKDVIEQQRLVASASPVPAVMRPSNLEVVSKYEKGKRTTVYRHLVAFEFTVSGQPWLSERVFPKRDVTDLETAQKIRADYPAGKTVAAWLVPSDPSASYLIREMEFTPYYYILGPMLYLSVGLGLIGSGVYRGSRRALPPQLDKTGWRMLRPIGTVVGRKKPWAMIGMAWYMVGVGVTAHYLTNAPRPWGIDALITLPAYFTVGIFSLVMWFRYARLSRHLADARVWVDTIDFPPGRNIRIRSEQMFLLPVPITSYKIGLLCEETSLAGDGKRKRKSTRLVYEDWSATKAFESAPSKEPIAAKLTAKPPIDQPASTSEIERGYPRYRWFIEVRAEIPGHRDYIARCPITVAATSKR